MTDMKRITVSFPDEIDGAILRLRETDQFANCSYSEIIRQLVDRGLTRINEDDTSSARDSA